MRVKYVRKNANGLGLNDRSVELLNHNYDHRGPAEDKDYGRKCHFLKFGHEANVYAMTIYDHYASYYILEPKYNTVTHFPAICFDVIDDKMSQYWHIKHRHLPAQPEWFFPEFARNVTYFAIKEWIQEPRFLEYLVDDKERELGIMNKMIKLMDAEF